MEGGYRDRAGLKVAGVLADLVEREALSGTPFAAEAFWRGLAEIFARFAPRNAALLAERDRMQAAIDKWHGERAGQDIDYRAYADFLRAIDYLVDEP